MNRRQVSADREDSNQPQDLRPDESEIPERESDVVSPKTGSKRSSSDGDQPDDHVKMVKEKDTPTSRDALISMLQTQLKRMEDLYKKSIDDQQDLRYKYGSVVQELDTLKLITNKLETDNKKLNSHSETDRSMLNERNELLQESEVWKKKYEELMKKVVDLESSQTEKKGDQINDLMNHIKKVENMLEEQKEKLDNVAVALDTTLGNLTRAEVTVPHEGTTIQVLPYNETTVPLISISRTGPQEPTLTGGLAVPSGSTSQFELQVPDTTPDPNELSIPRFASVQNNPLIQVIEPTPHKTIVSPSVSQQKFVSNYTLQLSQKPPSESPAQHGSPTKDLSASVIYRDFDFVASTPGSKKPKPFADINLSTIGPNPKPRGQKRLRTPTDTTFEDSMNANSSGLNTSRASSGRHTSLLNITLNQTSAHDKPIVYTSDPGQANPITPPYEVLPYPVAPPTLPMWNPNLDFQRRGLESNPSLNPLYLNAPIPARNVPQYDFPEFTPPLIPNVSHRDSSRRRKRLKQYEDLNQQQRKQVIRPALSTSDSFEGLLGPKQKQPSRRPTPWKEFERTEETLRKLQAQKDELERQQNFMEMDRERRLNRKGDLQSGGIDPNTVHNLLTQINKVNESRPTNTTLALQNLLEDVGESQILKKDKGRTHRKGLKQYADEILQGSQILNMDEYRAPKKKLKQYADERREQPENQFLNKDDSRTPSKRLKPYVDERQGQQDNQILNRDEYRTPKQGLEQHADERRRQQEDQSLNKDDSRTPGKRLKQYVDERQEQQESQILNRDEYRTPRKEVKQYTDERQEQQEDQIADKGEYRTPKKGLPQYDGERQEQQIRQTPSPTRPGRTPQKRREEFQDELEQPREEKALPAGQTETLKETLPVERLDRSKDAETSQRREDIPLREIDRNKRSEQQPFQERQQLLKVPSPTESLDWNKNLERQLSKETIPLKEMDRDQRVSPKISPISQEEPQQQLKRAFPAKRLERGKAISLDTHHAVREHLQSPQGTSIERPRKELKQTSLPEKIDRDKDLESSQRQKESIPDREIDSSDHRKIFPTKENLKDGQHKDSFERQQPSPRETSLAERLDLNKEIGSSQVYDTIPIEGTSTEDRSLQKKSDEREHSRRTSPSKTFDRREDLVNSRADQKAPAEREIQPSKRVSSTKRFQPHEKSKTFQAQNEDSTQSDEYLSLDGSDSVSGYGTPFKTVRYTGSKQNSFAKESPYIGLDRVARRNSQQYKRYPSAKKIDFQSSENELPRLDLTQKWLDYIQKSKKRPKDRVSLSEGGSNRNRWIFVSSSDDVTLPNDRKLGKQQYGPDYGYEEGIYSDGNKNENIRSGQNLSDSSSDERSQLLKDGRPNVRRQPIKPLSSTERGNPYQELLPFRNEEFFLADGRGPPKLEIISPDGSYQDLFIDPEELLSPPLLNTEPFGMETVAPGYRYTDPFPDMREVQRYPQLITDPFEMEPGVPDYRYTGVFPDTREVQRPLQLIPEPLEMEMVSPDYKYPDLFPGVREVQRPPPLLSTETLNRRQRLRSRQHRVSSLDIPSTSDIDMPKDFRKHYTDEYDDDVFEPPIQNIGIKEEPVFLIDPLTVQELKKQLNNVNQVNPTNKTLALKSLLDDVEEKEHSAIQPSTFKPISQNLQPFRVQQFANQFAGRDVALENKSRNISITETPDGRIAVQIAENRPTSRLDTPKDLSMKPLALENKRGRPEIVEIDSNYPAAQDDVDLQNERHKIQAQKEEIKRLKNDLKEYRAYMQNCIVDDRENRYKTSDLLENYQFEIQAMNDRYIETMHELDDVLNRNEILKEQVGELRKSLNYHQEQSDISGLEARKSTEKFAKLAALLEDAENKLKTKEEEIRKLRRLTGKSENCKCDELKKKNKELVEKIKENENYISNQQNQIQASENKLLEVMDNIKDYNKQSTMDTDQLMAMCNELDRKLQETKKELDKQNFRSKENDQNLQQIIDSNIEMQLQLQAGAEQERKIIGELNSIISKYDLEKKKLAADNNYLLHQLEAERRAFKNDHEKILKDLEKSSEENKALKAQLDDFNIKLKEREAAENMQLVKYKGDNADLQDKLDMSSAELKCLKEGRKNNSNLKAENSKLKNKIALLEKKLIELVDADQTILEFRLMNDNLKRKVKALENELRLSPRENSSVNCSNTGGSCQDGALKRLAPIKEEIIDLVPITSEVVEPPYKRTDVKLLYDNFMFDSEVSSKNSQDDSHHNLPSIDPIAKKRKSTCLPIRKNSRTKAELKRRPSQDQRTDVVKKPSQKLCPKSCKTAINKNLNPSNKPSHTGRIPMRTCSTCPHGYSIKRPK